MAVQQAGGNADPRIHALSVAINLEELDPTPFLQYLKTQVEYWWVDMIEEFTLAYQDGEFRVFEGLDTEDGAVELFELMVLVEGMATSGFWIKIRSSLSDEAVRVKMSLHESSETQRTEFSNKLLQAIKSSARIELERSICH